MVFVIATISLIICVDAFQSDNVLAGWGWAIIAFYASYRLLSVHFCSRLDRITFENIMRSEACDRGIEYDLVYDESRRRYRDKNVHQDFVKYKHGDWT